MWRGVDEPVDCVVTPFDAVFGFVQEVRSRCMECEQISVRYEKAGELVLDGGDESVEFPLTVTEAYSKWCCPVECDRKAACVGAKCAGKSTRRVTQRRVVGLPELLLVRFRRSASTRRDIRVEDFVSFPLSGKAELVAVIYDRGVRDNQRRYACASMAQDGCFWFFEEGSAPRRLTVDIGVLFVQSVVWLVYIPAGPQAWAAGEGQVMERVPRHQLIGSMEGSMHGCTTLCRDASMRD